MKISVIMPSLLEEFPDCAPNRPQKFIRAVDSFLEQRPMNRHELVIISDGCERTNEIVRKKYSQHLKNERINLICLERSPLFTGKIRQIGIDVAKGDAICNLDTDDLYLPHHLNNIEETFDISEYDWCFWNHLTAPDNVKDIDYVNDIKPELGSLCNANIAWRRALDVSWAGCDGRKDNQFFIKKLLDKYPKRQKIYGCGYVVKHLIISKQ